MVGYNAFATAAPLIDKMVSCGFVNFRNGGSQAAGLGTMRRVRIVETDSE